MLDNCCVVGWNNYVSKKTELWFLAFLYRINSDGL